MRGAGYTFSAPASWRIVRRPRQVQAVERSGTGALAAVTQFTLRRTFREALWPRVVLELDRAAHQLARGQHGAVTEAKTERVAGRRARRYEIVYGGAGKEVVERIVFVLRGKTEYLLLCRHERSKPTDACSLLLTSFRLT